MNAAPSIDALAARVPQLNEHTVAPPALAELPNQRHLEEDVKAAIASVPGDARGHAMLGNLFVRRALYLPAREAYRAAITRRGDFAEAHLAAAELSSILRDGEACAMHLRHALGLQRRYDDPLPLRGRTSVLMVLRDAPYNVNTPLEMILDRSRVALHKLYIGEEPQNPFVPSDLSFTAFGTAMDDRTVIDRATRFANGTPLVNEPQRLAVCARERLAQTLAGLQGVRVVETRVVPANGIAGIGLPALVRPVDTQAGFGLALITEPADVAAHAARFPSSAHHVSRFVDYRSADGYFRKFRIAIVDGIAYPYHLAISPRWMVHYLSSPMQEHEWMRAQEQAFLENPSTVFPHWNEWTQAIARAIGLEYVSLDVTRLSDGTMLVFEADPAMLLHDEDEGGIFAYKRSHVARIREALHALIDRKTSGVKAVSR